MPSFALKLIAIITMLIYHAGDVFHDFLPEQLYLAMRCAGRIAMPLFCFMVAEGLYHTKNVRKYAGRLLLFAVISELPFDLMFGGMTTAGLAEGRLWDFSGQNVFFTLLLGLLGILFYDMAAAKGMKWAALASILAAGVGANLINADYGIFGVFFIFVFYTFRGSRAGKAAGFTAGVLIYTGYNIVSYGVSFESAISAFELAALLPALLYNGKKGPGGKALQYAFYAFYPAHMLALWGIRNLIFGW